MKVIDILLIFSAGIALNGPAQALEPDHHKEETAAAPKVSPSAPGATANTGEGMRHVDQLTGSVLEFPGELQVVKDAENFTLRSRNGEFKVVIESGVYAAPVAPTSLFERMEKEGP